MEDSFQRARGWHIGENRKKIPANVMKAGSFTYTWDDMTQPVLPAYDEEGHSSMFGRSILLDSFAWPRICSRLLRKQNGELQIRIPALPWMEPNIKDSILIR